MLSLTPWAVSSSTMSRASGTERASRSSLLTTKGVAGPAGSQRLTQPGAGPVGTGQPVVDVDPFRVHAERGERLALGGEVLLLGFSLEGCLPRLGRHGGPESAL
jgi:hypothetical protein